MTISEKITWVAAIDIGTSYSCYSYSSRKSRHDVIPSCFKDGLNRTPTSILVNKDKKFVAFGQEAEDQYKETIAQNDASDFLFTEFKLEIHDNPTLSITKTIATDVSGKCRMLVFKLLTMTISYLKNHLVKAINCGKETYSEDEIHFVLTCPAIWSDRAKYFLRLAAMKAGIKADCLTLAYESEAVSLWCKNFKHVNPGFISLQTAGTKYVVVDVGGGVTDMSYLEATSNMSVNAACPARGGIWGGVVADKCFKTYLSLLFGPEVLKHFQESYPSELYFLMKDFEVIKKFIDKNVKAVKIKIPKALLDLAQAYHSVQNEQELSNKIKSSYFGEHFKLSKEHLEIDDEFTLAMFDYTAKQIGFELQDLNPKFDTVILTGGLASVVKSKLGGLMNGQKVVVPADNSLFVTMGAVLYGHDQKVVRSRASNLTYGIKQIVPYDETKHNGGDTAVINGIKMCTNEFHVLLEAGVRVNSGYQLKEKDKPISGEDKVQLFEIFSCGKNKVLPTLTSDQTVTPVATFALPLPFGCLTDDKVFERCFTFGETEIKCRVTFEKGKQEPVTFYLEYK